jgi:hypothetical protein
VSRGDPITQSSLLFFYGHMGMAVISRLESMVEHGYVRVNVVGLACGLNRNVGNSGKSVFK